MPHTMRQLGELRRSTQIEANACPLENDGSHTKADWYSLLTVSNGQFLAELAYWSLSVLEKPPTISRLKHYSGNPGWTFLT